MNPAMFSSDATENVFLYSCTRFVNAPKWPFEALDHPLVSDEYHDAGTSPAV